jgi:hypothetical protein
MSPFRIKLSAIGLISGALLLGAGGAALAQQAARVPDTMPASPKFVVLKATHPERLGQAGGLTLWNWTYTFQGTNYSDKFVGNPPTGAATTTPTFIIPLKIVIGTFSTSTSTVQANGQTALSDTTNSPIFQSNVDFKEAGQDLGMTQYEDAFQRESFAVSIVHAHNRNYHVLLGTPTVLPEVTITPPASKGKVGTEFGVKVALVDINYLDGQINAIIAANPQITASAVPIFVMYDTYETSGGCCIGGYHSATGAQTYAVFDYIGTPGAFSQDVSALSHEVGEWLDDPLINNNSPCGIYETGDPLEGETNFGGYPYVANGMTYNLQDLAQPPYFGGPNGVTLGNRKTFQGTALGVCANGA